MARLLRVGWQAVRYASNYTESAAREEAHAASTMLTWKRISLFVAVPVVGYLAWKNLIHGEHMEEKEYFPWPHLRIRNKPFPWGDGDKSLFHNPHTNPVPLSSSSEPTEAKVSLLSRLWEQYLMDDPEVREKELNDHLLYMQRRREQYLAKKKMKEEPIQPMDIVREMKYTPKNPVHSGIDN
ncbi:hypothetical protein EMCRGX_G016258 [Ephydatia muelleri]